MNAISFRIFASVIPAIFLLSFVVAAIRKVKVYDAFTEGCKGAIPLVLSVFPYIATVMMLAKVFEASGLEHRLVGALAPLFRGLWIPEELAELILIKPLSGSGATAALSDVVAKYGTDSYIGRCACVVYGASETVFYIGAVYFAGRKKKRLTAALLISLFAYFSSVVLCCALCKIM